MPAGQPFTKLCLRLARPAATGRADLHVHTTFSDGLYSPAQIVDLARRSGMAAVAITDHDTLQGIWPAREAARGDLEIISGVEITSEFAGKELHLLGYFVDPENADLTESLAGLRQDRAVRFREMVNRLRELGVALEDDDLPPAASLASLGRRHLAEALVNIRAAATVREAFQRYLGDKGRATMPKRRVPVSEAIALVRGAGGVAAWAHPTYDCSRESLAELKRFGMEALEVDFPSVRPARAKVLRSLAAEVGLAVTGGSDCHGPGQPHRDVGARGVSADELRRLRDLACSASNELDSTERVR